MRDTSVLLVARWGVLIVEQSGFRDTLDYPANGVYLTI